MSRKGIFITFEGSEGCGKSTQSQLIFDDLQQQNRRVRLIREPGGVVISEKIRDILLDKNHGEMNKECETLLYMAARAQVVEDVIIPELQQGTILLCDRFLDSTIAYQGYGCGVNVDIIKTMGLFATKGIQPDITFFLDLDTQEGLNRRGRERDRIELRSKEYHDKVRYGYQQIAKQDPQRVIMLDGSQSKQALFSQIKQHIDKII